MKKSDEQVVLTRSGYERLREELSHLRTAGRQEVAKELEFARVLRNQDRMAMHGQGPLKAAVPAPVETQPLKESQSSSAKTAAKNNATQTKEAQSTEVAPPPKPKGLFDYVYQVAAVKGDDNADALRQRLEGRGFRTSLMRKGKLLLILVKLRGDAKLGPQVVQLLKQMHLGQPILVSRRPVK